MNVRQRLGFVKRFNYRNQATEYINKIFPSYIRAKVFKKAYLPYFISGGLILIFIELTEYGTAKMLGLPYFIFPESWYVLYHMLHSIYWYLPVIILTLLSSITFGVAGLLKKLEHAEFLILIPLFFITAIIISSIFWTTLTKNPLDLNPFVYYSRLMYYRGDFDFWVSSLIGLVLSSLLILYPNIRRVLYANDIYGHSRFATLFDLYQTGMLKKENEGILVGTYLKYFKIYSNDFTHLLILAPSGSGKTTALAIPNLFTFTGSIITTDLKCSLHKLTSGYRQTVLGNTCYLFAPMDDHSHCFNCFATVSQDKNRRIGELQKISEIVLPGKDERALTWINPARELFVALALYLFDTKGNCTLGDIAETVKQADFDLWLTEKLEVPGLDKLFYRMASGYLSIIAAETRSGVLFNLGGKLGLYLDPIIRAATSKSDFDLRDLRRKKMTVYLGIPQNELNRLAPLLNLFWELATSYMNTKVPDLKEEPHPVLFNMDEFGNIGRLNELRLNMNLMREYRVRYMIYFQYLDQSEEQYSRAEAAAFRNLKTKIVFCQSDMKDAEYVSKLSGMQTVRYRNRSQNVNSRDQSQGSSEQITKRPLINEDTIRRVKPEDMFIFVDGQYPIRARKDFYYKDSAFKGNVISPAAVPALKFRANLNHSVTNVTPVEKIMKTQIPLENTKEKLVQNMDV